MAYRLYVDEVGNDDLTHTNDDRHRYLSLSGIIMDQSYGDGAATTALNTLKMRFFESYPLNPVWLHRKDIIQRSGPFKVLNDDEVRGRFDTALLAYLTDTNYTLVTAVIDKLEMMNQRHWEQRHPYHYLMSILVEKYVKWLVRKNSTGDIMPEKRHGRQDEALQAAYDNVRLYGTRYETADIIKARIPSAPLKFRSKKHNETGLQICDLVAHPSHTNIRRQRGHDVRFGPFAEKIVPILHETKYDRSQWWGKIDGYGIKYLP